ncbi:MAG TPA: class D sortase [Thermoanaerobaculia bacterium]|jgi:sortase A
MKSFAVDRKAGLRWLERLLLLAGVLCLGGYAYAWLDTSVTQYRENRLLEESLSALRPARRGAPAAETDSLETFRERDRSAPRREPGPEGSLLGRLEIPRIGVSAIVLEGTGKKTLRRAVGHIPETELPGEPGNVGVAAHRDSFFRGLKDIRKNDIITLKTLAGTFRYRVEWTEIVRPEDTHVLDDTGSPALTLVTCYPFYYVGSAPKRFIVRARQVDEREAADSSAASGVE